MKERKLQDGELYESRFQWKEKRSNNRFMLFLVLLLSAIVAFTSWFHVNFSGVQVSGPSMMKTLKDGEYLLMRSVYGGEGFTYGDVVVVSVEHYPEVQEENKHKPEGEETKFLIKRVIAMAGDKVKFENGEMYLWKDYQSGGGYEKLNEPYAYYASRNKYKCSEYTVGEGEVFFLGDNRNYSKDSRYLDGNSHLAKLYQATDICGVVPEWAIRYQTPLEWIFFFGRN
ncbi:MAG: signal peptidase I [Clostridia bacterium]|nr:signal peptidase I [Clostridia bacterium]